MVESLTSYLARLSEVHFVTVGTLINQVIARELGIFEDCRHIGSKLYRHWAALNRAGKQTDYFCSALLKLTGRDVIPLTLKSWGDVIPSTNLLRNHKAWCPLCLEGWKNNRLPVYEPLIWSFKVIEICGIHNAYLDTQCPLCNLKIPVISSKSRAGYCSYCGCWLGSQTARHPDTLVDSSWNNFVLSNIGDLIREGASLPKSYFTDFIKMLIDVAGGLNAFSKYFNIAKSSLSEWLNGLHRPSLYMILKICFALRVDILSANNSRGFELHNKFEKISPKYETKRRKIDWAYVETVLTTILDSIAHPSVREVAKELNIDQRLLYYHFPSLCKEISKKHAVHIKLRKNVRLKKGYEEVRKAVMHAQSAGVFPSRSTVEQLLPSPEILRERPFYELWKELINNIYS